MFEKSLYDLIKGLRHHKGAEDEYIQNSLRECKVEIKSQDMDKKATALLKLIYLEMFGYDMSWASFHVLEVMSSIKYLQKRVGYLGAVQSFRPDTEVLMLATNLLKKDIVSSTAANMSLPLVTLPHIITPSLSMSLLPDVLPRLSHSHAAIRKKAVVCLYRLALVYPEALKLAWPKIRERLMDDQEDSSVTTAVINVVCELGWRRPHDFLPLAPRFFDLLVEGGNNWMAIKIIKLFATLTTLEPRLIRKLLRPLANIIQTTTAMSLLYECINGIIQGGILDGDESSKEMDEIASLCVGKLRGMIVMDADPNLKYVALLAFNRIVITHPVLVSMQQDVIMGCLEDADISIRLQALELAAGMVNRDTLQSVVNRLVDQLCNSPASEFQEFGTDSEIVKDLGPYAQVDDGLSEERLTSQEKRTEQTAPLPVDYRVEILHRILDICSRNNYADLLDFEWYVNVLVQLVRHIPPPDTQGHSCDSTTTQGTTDELGENVASRIGSEIRNVAVRVRSVRMEATRAAESLILIDNRKLLFSTISDSSYGVLGPLAWVVGEYATYLEHPDSALQSLVHPSNISLPARTLSLYVQAIPKVLIRITTDGRSWKNLQRSEISLTLARIIDFLEALAVHPDLDVQERSIEFLEILRLSADSMRTEISHTQEVPFLLSSIMPGFFSGLELNPVAASAQKQVPLPEDLCLDRTLNESLVDLLNNSGGWKFDSRDEMPSQEFYHSKDGPAITPKPSGLTQTDMQLSMPYRDLPSGPGDNIAAQERRRAERKDRYRDDPFYIGADDESSGRSTPFHQAFNASNGDALDIDSIPIVDLKIENEGIYHTAPLGSRPPHRKSQSRRKKFDVAVDETIGCEDTPGKSMVVGIPDEPYKVRRSLLQVDSSVLGDLSLEGDIHPGSVLSQPVARGHDDTDEMAMAMQEVERVRLEMQRASERIHLQGTPAEGTLVKKKKKREKHLLGMKAENVDSMPPNRDPAAGKGSEEGHEPDLTVQKKKKKKSKQTSSIGGL